MSLFRLLTLLFPLLLQVSRNSSGFKQSTNMVIYKMKTGGLFLHLPLALKEETIRELELLGPIEVFCSPFYLHSFLNPF